MIHARAEAAREPTGLERPAVWPPVVTGTGAVVAVVSCVGGGGATGTPNEAAAAASCWRNSISDGRRVGSGSSARVTGPASAAGTEAGRAGGGARNLRARKASIGSSGRCSNNGDPTSAVASVEASPYTSLHGPSGSLRRISGATCSGVKAIWSVVVIDCPTSSRAIPKSPNLPARRGQQDVARLDVPMEDPELVRRRQRISDGDAHRRHLSGRHRTLGGDDVGERTTVEELRHQVRLPAADRPAVYTVTTLGWAERRAMVCASRRNSRHTLGSSTSRRSTLTATRRSSDSCRAK